MEISVTEFRNFGVFRVLVIVYNRFRESHNFLRERFYIREQNGSALDEKYLSRKKAALFQFIVSSIVFSPYLVPAKLLSSISSEGKTSARVDG